MGGRGWSGWGGKKWRLKKMMIKNKGSEWGGGADCKKKIISICDDSFLKKIPILLFVMTDRQTNKQNSYVL